MAILFSLPLAFADEAHISFWRRILPYWGPVCVVLALAVFANMGRFVFAEISIPPIIGISIVHMVFAAICLWQIRRFVRNTANDAADVLAFRAQHEGRAGTYIFLMVLILIAPEISGVLASPLAGSLLLLCILALVSPLAKIAGMGLSSLYRQFSENRMAKGLVNVAVFSTLLISVTVVSTLWNKYPEETFFPSSISSRDAKQRQVKPNVIIFVIDMLRADHVGCYGYARDTTPNIDTFAREGVLYNNAYCEAPWTRPSVATLLSGLYPTVHGANTYQSSLSDEVTTIAEILGDHGYATGAFICNPTIDIKSNLDQGFGIYYQECTTASYFGCAKMSSAIISNIMVGIEVTKLLFSRYAYDVYSVPDTAQMDIYRGGEMMGVEHLNGWALRWVEDNLSSPFFLYLHYFDVHGPYVPPHPFVENFSGDWLEETINLYDGGLRHVDTHIGLFISQLEQLGICDNSIMLITSDHGHGFMEHGVEDHGQHLYEEQIRVPLIFLHSSAFPFSGTVYEPVGLVDVLPTLIDYLNLKPPEIIMDGRSFASSFRTDTWPDAPEYRYAETALYIPKTRSAPLNGITYRNRWKYICTTSNSNEQLFDLSIDPQERVNLVKKEPLMAEHLRKRLNETAAACQSRAYAASFFLPNERTAQLIKALGYVE